MLTADLSNVTATSSLGLCKNAEDAVQETLVSAWRTLGTFQGRAIPSLVALPDCHEPLSRRRLRVGGVRSRGRW